MSTVDAAPGAPAVGSISPHAAPTGAHCVGHTDSATDAALDAYVAAFRAGRSILVRPKADFEGLTQVVACVETLAGAPVFVTDLESTPAPAGGSASAPEQALFAYHTSGSTGSPKCVIYRHEQVVSHARAVTAALDLNTDTL